MFKELIDKKIVKNHFGWKIAFLQHPMYLLINEDRGEPKVGERIPPWGAEFGNEYVERIDRNLYSLKKYPDLYLNYEFSGYEIEDICKNYPKTYAEMKKLFKEGRLDFVNCTYSQAHLQVFSSESVYRQFKEGNRVFKKLFGMDAQIYAAQETGICHQLPQLLKMFGYKFMVVPCFPWSMEIFGGELELHGQYRGLDSTKDDCFVSGVALNGDSIPVYIKTVDAQEDYLKSALVTEEISKDSYGGGTLWTFTPDMAEVSDEFYNDTKKKFDFALLKNELPILSEKYPPRAKARFFTHWSYCSEGVWADALQCALKKAEEKLIAYESFLALNADCSQEEFIRDAWLLLLKFQHHDVHWTEVTDLREKGINAALNLYQEICLKETGEYIFNPTLNTVNAVLEGKGKTQSYFGRDIGLTRIKPSSSVLSTKHIAYKSKPCSKSTVELKDFKITLLKNGHIASIQDLKDPEKEIIKKQTAFQFGQIKGMYDGKYYDDNAFSSSVFDGKIFTAVRRQGNVGKTKVVQDLFFFKKENFIKIETEFFFNGEEIGTFLLDETKLNFYYPLADEKLVHNIPFGITDVKSSAAFFATDYVFNDNVMFVNKGNCKFIFQDNILSNVIAWSGDTFTNRMHESWENNRYDLRIYESKKIEQYIFLDRKFTSKKADAQYRSTLPVVACKEELQLSLKVPKTLVLSGFSRENALHIRGYDAKTFNIIDEDIS